MANWAKPKRFTADGSLEADDKACVVYSVTIETDGTNAATVALEIGSGGTVAWQGICEGAVRSRHFDFPKGIFVGDTFVNLTGTGAACSIAYDVVTP